MISPDLAETVKRLRELLPKATQEAWKYVDGEDGRPFVCTEGDIICVPDGNHQPPDAMDLGNFAYIAAANPAAISSILDALEGLERERDEARELHEMADNALAVVMNALGVQSVAAAQARITSLESSLAEARKGARTPCPNCGAGMAGRADIHAADCPLARVVGTP